MPDFASLLLASVTQQAEALALKYQGMTAEEIKAAQRAEHDRSMEAWRQYQLAKPFDDRNFE